MLSAMDAANIIIRCKSVTVKIYTAGHSDKNHVTILQQQPKYPIMCDLGLMHEYNYYYYKKGLFAAHEVN